MNKNILFNINCKIRFMEDCKKFFKNLVYSIILEYKNGRVQNLKIILSNKKEIPVKLISSKRDRFVTRLSQSQNSNNLNYKYVLMNIDESNFNNPKYFFLNFNEISNLQKMQIYQLLQKVRFQFLILLMKLIIYQ
ncbi:hypothetical protein [Clostridium sp.]|uniref:hypothetical protein n=1 Tax=Clostridium sp. TaxID=1506 RepID=UPI00359F87EB